MIQTILLLMMASQVMAQSKVYVSTDKNGNTVYSDIPLNGAKAVVVGNSITIQSPPKSSTVTIPRQSESPSYQVIISQPKDNATVRNNNGSVDVKFRVIPPLKANHHISLLLDGNKYTGNTTVNNLTGFSLQNIDRGTHTIKAELKNDKGKVIASSLPITFYMHRASIIGTK